MFASIWPCYSLLTNESRTNLIAFCRFSSVYLASGLGVGARAGAGAGARAKAGVEALKVVGVGVGVPLSLVWVFPASLSSRAGGGGLQHVCGPTISPKVNYKASVSSKRAG